MGVVLVTVGPSIADAQVVGAASVAPRDPSLKAKTIEIPQDTPVIVHFFRPQGLEEYNARNDVNNSAVLQVDSDVVINGVIVIPVGSLGLAHVDSMNYSAAKVFNGNYFHMLWVFSIASTQLPLIHRASRRPWSIIS